MRLLPIFLYNHTAYVRLERIKRKQKERLQRLIEATEYLDKWDDIPMNQLYPSLCEILKINNNAGARNFLMDLNFGRPDLKKMAKKLPLV